MSVVVHCNAKNLQLNIGTFLFLPLYWIYAEAYQPWFLFFQKTKSRKKN